MKSIVNRLKTNENQRKIVEINCVLGCFVKCAMLEKSEKRKQDRHETCNASTSKRFELGPRSKGEAKEQRREGQARILTLKGRFWDHVGVVFGSRRGRFWVQKVF